MGNLLTVNSVMACPHGGIVQAVTSNARAQANSGYILLMSDTFTISGCPFQVPAGPTTKPQPCVKVQWTNSALRVKVSDPVLTDSCVGICQSVEGIPQGSVQITFTQPLVSGE